MTRERLGLAAIALAFGLHALYLHCVVEDAFISFRFAANLANGHGLVWNVGEPPVEGYTNFLWVLVCALALRLGVDPTVAAPLLGALAGLATLIALHRLCRRGLGWKPLAAAVPSALLACSGPFATWSTSGMETSAFTLLALLGCCGLIRHARSGSARDASAAYGFAALSTLVRPEGLLVFGVLAACGALAVLGPRPRAPGALGRWLAPLVVSAGFLLAYFAWRWSYFGYPLPNTFYAKTGGGSAQLVRGGLYSLLFYAYFAAPLLLLPALVAARGGPRRARSAVEAAALRVCGALILAWSAYVVAVGGDYMAMHRFFVPVLPQLYLLFGFAARAALDPAPRAAGDRALTWATLLVAAGMTLVYSTPLEHRLTTPIVHHGGHQGVATERWHAARLTRIGHFFDGYKQSPQETLATPAIGAIGYYSGMRVYGFQGLVDPRIAHMPVDRERWARLAAGHGRVASAYVLSKRPTYVVFNRELTRAPLAFPSLDPELDAEIRERYRLRSVRLVDEANGEQGWFSFLERRDARP